MTYTILSWSPRLNQVWHTPVIEAEQVIRDALNAKVCRLEAHRLTTFRGTKMRRFVDPIPPLKLSPALVQRADVGVAIFPNGSVVSELGLVKSWKGLANRWIAIVHEIWPDHVALNASLIEDTLSQFDAVAVMTKAGEQELRRRFPALPVEFAPFAIDARSLRYKSPDRRSITLYNPGRRDAVQHDSLASAVGEGLYLFDTFKPGAVPDLMVHRNAYLNTITHSRLMVTNYAKFDQPSETGGIQEAGLRITEALGCGAIPIGHHPPNIDMQGLDTSWFGPLMPIGQSVDADVIHDTLANHSLGDRVAVEGPRFVALQHDWSNRIAELLTRAGLAIPTSLLEHQNKLQTTWSAGS
jgi:hypothetical protein